MGSDTRCRTWDNPRITCSRTGFYHNYLSSLSKRIAYDFYQTNDYNRLKGADPDLKDRKTHASSLHLAMDKGNEYAFRILLEKTKNLEDVNNKGISLLQLGKIAYSWISWTEGILGTGKKSWMNDQLVHELEKRGLRRSRGIKRIISTHKKRMGFMFTISLAFIISGTP